MLLTPLLYVHVPTLEIVRIRLYPFPLALPLTLCPALRITAALLGFPCPRIRPIKPATVDTPLLSSLCCFHTLILTDEGIAKLMGACIRKLKELNTSNVWRELNEE